MQWLAAHRGWLLILDNVTDPADVAPLLARAPAGRYLITSRRATGWHATAVPVRLDVLDPAEADALLTAILTQDRPREVDGAGSCVRSWASCRWPSSRSAPTSPRPAPRRGSTWTCWPAIRPPCTRPPRKAATRPAPSPGSGASRWTGWLMTRWPGRCCGSWPGTRPRRSRALLDGLADPRALLRAVSRLAAYSMLTADAGTLAMHRLVQAVTRTPDPGDPHRDPRAIDDARDQATRQLADAVPADWKDPAGWPTWRMLLPHIDALASHAPPDADTETTAYLLNGAGAFLEGQGQPAARPGTSSVPSPTARGSWAGPPQDPGLPRQPRPRLPGGGDLGRAIPLHEQTLADFARVLGEHHPRPRSCVATSLRRSGPDSPGGVLCVVVNRTILDMITGGVPDRAGTAR